MISRAFSPAHITGFFEICDGNRSPLHVGSRGAGFSIERGMLTKVEIGGLIGSHVEIRINGQRIEDARVSKAIVNRYLSMIETRSHVRVDHFIDVPIGAGFGASGAAALSLSLSLNEALETGLSDVEAAQLAHEVEIECKTGLGTIIAEFLGGFEIRTEPGAPGVGKARKIPMNGDYRVVCLSLNRIPTNTIITDEEFKGRINSRGRAMVGELLRNPTIENFLRLSNRFTMQTDLMTERLRKMMFELRERGYTAGMTMLGEGIFTIVRGNEAEEVMETLGRYGDGGFLTCCRIDDEGAHLL